MPMAAGERAGRRKSGGADASAADSNADELGATAIAIADPMAGRAARAASSQRRREHARSTTAAQCIERERAGVARSLARRCRQSVAGDVERLTCATAAPRHWLCVATSALQLRRIATTSGRQVKPVGHRLPLGLLYRATGAFDWGSDSVIAPVCFVTSPERVARMRNRRQDRSAHFRCARLESSLCLRTDASPCKRIRVMEHRELQPNGDHSALFSVDTAKATAHYVTRTKTAH